MAKAKQLFVCAHCGNTESKWLGRCPACGSWNSLEEQDQNSRFTDSHIPAVIRPEAIVRLDELESSNSIRFQTGMPEFDRMLGGGIVEGSAVLLGGEPGIGKSTLMLQVIDSLGRDCLYVSGEESPSQIRLRADRLHINSSLVTLYSDTDVGSIVSVLQRDRPSLVVIDSIQTLSSKELGPVPGTVNQIKYCCMELIDWAKRSGCALFLIGHITKDGAIAGPKVIEHMVDTVCLFEQASGGVRIIRASKNRFGSVDEIGVFTMEEDGLKGVENASAFFLGRRKASLPAGTVSTVVYEGTRMFMVEIQALTVGAKNGYSRVFSDRIDSARISRISAVLEKHAGLPFSTTDIYVNVAGGIKLKEVSIELAIAAALYSAITQKPLKNMIVITGELSLAGEVRPVSHLGKRIKTSEDMGFSGIVCPATTLGTAVSLPPDVRSIEVIGCETIGDLVSAIS